MATAKKGKKSSSPKRGSKKKKNINNMNSFSKFMLILLLVAVLVGAVFYTLKNFKIANDQQSAASSQHTTANSQKPKDNSQKPKADSQQATANNQQPKANSQKTTSTKANAEEKTAVLKQEFKEAKTMSGSWQSSEQGAFLTMDEYGYRIDFANVHASKPMTGSYFIENNLITFTSDGDECYDNDGTYRITFYKKNISLTCKNDECTDRKNILEADWEWLEY